MKASKEHKQDMRAYYKEHRAHKLAYQRRYYKKNREHIRQRTKSWWQRTQKTRAKIKRKWRLSQYGLTPKKLAEEKKKQNSRCVICGDKWKGEPATDHNHRTKKFRGLLCHSCNRGLGFFKDSPALLRQASLYLFERGYANPLG